MKLSKKSLYLIFFVFFLCSFWFFQSPCFADARKSIEGRVVEKTTGKAIPYARITVDGISSYTTADSLGYFTLHDLPPGWFTVRASHIGYEPEAQSNIQVVEGSFKSLAFHLKDSPIPLAPLNIVGSRISPSGSPDRVLEHEFLIESGASALSDAICHFPGISATTDPASGGETRLSMRGSSPEQVTVLLDGLVLNNPQTGRSDINSIPMNAVEKIEIHKGGAESSAIGGTINLVSRKAHSGNFQALQSLSLGSFETLETATSISGAALGKLDTYISYEAQHSLRGYSYPKTDQNLLRKNSQFSREQLFLKAMKSVHSMDLIFLSNMNRSFREIPGTLNAPTPHSFVKDQKYLINFSIKDYHIHDNLMMAVNTGFVELHELYRELDFYHINTSYDTKTFEAQLSMKYAPFQKSNIEFGFQFLNQQLFTENYNLVLKPSWTANNNLFSTNIAGYLTKNIRGFDFNFVPSVILHTASNYPSYASPCFKASVFNGSTLRYGVFTTHGRSLRIPAFNELYWQNDLFASGNPDLKPEKAYTHDLGIRLCHEFFTAEASYFKKNISDLIYWIPSARNVWSPHNLGNAEISGFECDMFFSPFKSVLKFDCSFTVQDPRDLEGSEETSKNTYNKYLVYRPLKNGHCSVHVFNNFSVPLHLILDSIYISSRYVTRANTKAIPSYYLFDLTLSSGFSISENNQLETAFKIKNFLNYEYFVVADSPGQGREFILSVALKSGEGHSEYE